MAAGIRRAVTRARRRLKAKARNIARKARHLRQASNSAVRKHKLNPRKARAKKHRLNRKLKAAAARVHTAAGGQ
jgi:hypothetical protein